MAGEEKKSGTNWTGGIAVLAVALAISPYLFQREAPLVGSRPAIEEIVIEEPGLLQRGRAAARLCYGRTHLPPFLNLSIIRPGKNSKNPALPGRLILKPLTWNDIIHPFSFPSRHDKDPVVGYFYRELFFSRITRALIYMAAMVFV